MKFCFFLSVVFEKYQVLDGLVDEREIQQDNDLSGDLLVEKLEKGKLFVLVSQTNPLERDDGLTEKI